MMSDISCVRLSHYNDLARFLENFSRSHYKNENENEYYWKRKFELWWDKNPAFSSKTERGWILLNKGEIVGFLGNIPTWFWFQGKQIVVYNATTWRVLDAYRNRSLLLIESIINASSETILFNSTPSDTVGKILEFLDFKIVPNSEVKTYVYLIPSTRLMKINLKSILGISLFDRYIFQLIGKVCVLILGTYQSLRRIGIRQRENAAKRIEHIDSSFDELWAATKSTIDNTPLRTSAVLDWYCSATEDFEKILFGYYEHGELKGYALFNTNIHMERGIKYLDCIDIWGRHRSTEMINAVIIAATDYAEDNAIDMVTFSSFDDEVGDCFKRVGRIGFTSARPRYFKTNANNQEAIYQSQSYFTKFLGDYAL